MADESDKTRGGRVRPNQLQILDEVGLFRVPVLGIRGKDILSTNGRRYIDFCQTSYLYFDFDPLLNDRIARLVGEVVTVVEPVSDHGGRVRVGDGEWPARGPDAPIGARVRITGATGATLRVEPLPTLPQK